MVFPNGGGWGLPFSHIVPFFIARISFLVFTYYLVSFKKQICPYFSVLDNIFVSDIRVIKAEFLYGENIDHVEKKSSK